MKTVTREFKVANDKKDLENWFKSEYPRGIELYFVDYNDDLDDSPNIITELIKGGYSDSLHESMMDYDHSYTFDEIKKNYLNYIGADEISDDLLEYIHEWCHENDKSDYQKDLLRNTSAQLFFIDTGVEVLENNENLNEIIRKFGKKDDKKIKAIKWIGNEQMYHSTISFYFHADPADIIEVLHRDTDKYIAIDGALIGNVTRGNGSNWLHDDNVFQLVIPKKAFIENVYLDSDKRTGYGWHSICGDWNTNTCSVSSSNKKNIKGYSYIEGETSMEMIRQREYAENWKRGECTFGDMNITRHKETPYINNMPCGNKCTKCGTFWID